MRIKRLLFIFATLLALAVGLPAACLWLSLPQLEGQAALPGLRSKAEVQRDGLGIPTIQAANRDDAVRALGWLHAQDRLFQMELMRRKGAGRLAELFGPAAVELDRRQRGFGFEQAARAIVAALPAGQRQAQQAYADGVNAFIAQARLLPPEFLLLRHRPEPWRVEDNLLVGLMMFQTLNSGEEEERMLTVMAQALPKEVVRFLTPDTGAYDTVLVGGPQSRRPALPIPVQAWAGLGQAARAEGGVDALSHIVGSNQWTVGGSKTHDGRAILANDMHLSLGVPNTWYRASLRYAGLALDGVTLPGLPVLVVGSNRHLAWGFTNVDADVLDLVRLELNPANPQEYRTPAGWRAFERRVETIAVKGGAAQTVEFADTVWGPVSPRPLLGQPVALHWTALQAAGVDLGQMDLDGAQTLEQAMALVNRSGGPNQNVAFADSAGRIGWTLLGRYPLRRGFDGATSVSWADGQYGWDGFISADALPRLLNPAEGYIATANNRTVGREYPYPLGHNQANGYRAWRIAEQIKAKDKLDEADLLAVQLDTRSEFFEFYRQLALAFLDGPARQDPLLDEAYRYIQAWDGRMEAESLGIGLLWAWRERLASTVFAPAVARCRQLDPAFAYTWRQMETPLRSLLAERLPQTLPDGRYRDWRDLLLQSLADTAAELKQGNAGQALAGLAWGEINRAPVRHPFSKSMPWLAPLLDMADKPVSGCAGFCVRVVGNNHGASERLVVSPGHLEQAILHMPGGQSGHPLSPHYRDQHPAWQSGLALPLLPGQPKHSLKLVPRS